MLCGFLPYNKVNQPQVCVWVCVCVCVCTYIHRPFLVSLPLHCRTPLSCHGAPGWAPCTVQQIPPSCAMDLTHSNVCMATLLSPFISASPPPTPTHVHSQRLHLHSCPANRFISTIFFLDSIYIYIYVNIQHLFFWLTLLCIIGSRFIYFNSTDSNSFLCMAEWYSIILF